jgi:hypothetical protein
MSYYFGFNLQNHAVLISDKKNTAYGMDGEIVTSLEPKLWKVRDDLYMTAAGMIYLAKDVASRVLPQALGRSPLRRDLLEKALPEWTNFFDRNHKALEANFRKQLMEAGQNPDFTSQDTGFLVGGVDVNGTRFLIDFHSMQGFKPNLFYKKFQACVPAFYPTGMNEQEATAFNQKLIKETTDRLRILLNVKREKDRVQRAVELMPEVIAWVASYDECVSKEYDMAVVGKDGAQEFAG